MNEETAAPSEKSKLKLGVLLRTSAIFVLGIAAGTLVTFLYFSYFGKSAGFDYSTINWFGNSNVTPTVTVFENPFSQGGSVTPSVSPNPSASPSATPTYINPFDLIGQ